MSGAAVLPLPESTAFSALGGVLFADTGNSVSAVTVSPTFGSALLFGVMSTAMYLPISAVLHTYVLEVSPSIAVHALLSGEDKYYILSGKVKAEDVLAYITRMNEDEIVVMSKYVIGKQREYFDFT